MRSRKISQENVDEPATPSGPDRARAWRRRLLGGLAALVVVAVGIRIAVPFLLAPSRPEINVVDIAPGADPEVAALVEEAAEVVEGLIERLRDRVEAWDVLGGFYYKFGKRDEALNCWEQCLELDPNSSEAHYWVGIVARDRGRNEEAVESFRKAHALNPSEPQVSVHLAQTLIDLGETEEAIKVLEENLAAYPGSLPSFVLLGEIYVQLKQHDKAKEHLETAVEMDPAYTTAYYGLAKACAGLGEKAESSRYMEKFKELKAADEQAHRDWLKARDDLPSVRRRVSEIYTAAGKAYLAHGYVEMAEELSLRAVELCPSQPECYLVLAWLYERQGRLDEARDVLLRASQANPDDLGVQLRLGVFLAEQGQFDAAEKALNEAIRLMPYLGGGYAALARVHLTFGRKLSEAKELAAKAVELEPLAKNYFLLGLVCQRVGDLASAREAIERAIELEPANPEYRQARELLQGGKAE
ncbi:MAG: tetratricopeptide repeat protein [Planctomycetota bacterium]